MPKKNPYSNRKKYHTWMRKLHKRHFVIFDKVIGEEQLYDDAASQALKFICKSFGNICFLYSIKSFLVLPKSLVDAELIYNLSSLDHFDILHLLRSDLINMALMQVSHPRVIFFCCYTGFFLACTS